MVLKSGPPLRRPGAETAAAPGGDPPAWWRLRAEISSQGREACSLMERKKCTTVKKMESVNNPNGETSDDDRSE